MRKFGFKVYFGDAARLDLLEIAGAKSAKILVVAVDEKDMGFKIIALAQRHFPHLRIVARAFDVGHYYELRKLGVDVVEREMFEGSLKLGRECLQIMGMGAYEARELTDVFRDTNYEMLMRYESIRDDKDFVKLVRKNNEELERQMETQVKQPQPTQEWRESLKRLGDELL